jgi:ubiquinone biosynthesis monooxygenase Coq7
MRRLSRWDRVLGDVNRLLDGASRLQTQPDRAVADPSFAAQTEPRAPLSAEPERQAAARPIAAAEGEMSPQEMRHAAALMRVNHVGEVCAQALYQGQAATARDQGLRHYLLDAAGEERRHLDWTRQRIDELGSRPSRLVPFWYLSSYLIGIGAGLGGDSVSLGFMAETERQVEAHLAGHLDSLPAADHRSRQIVETMQMEEVRHAQGALARGGHLPPWPVRTLMRAMARVMTTTAYRI